MTRLRLAPRSILVVQAWGIGDVIMTTPMLRAIRDRWPDVRLLLAVRSPAVAELVCTPGLVDRVLLIPDWRRRLRFGAWLVGLRKSKIDLAIVATRHHTVWPALLRRLAGVREIAADSPSVALRGVRYHRCVAEADTEHRVESNLALLELIAGPVRRTPPALNVSPADAARAHALLGALDISRGTDVIGVHAGSDPRVPQKRYPGAALRTALLELLERAPDAHAVILFGGERTDDRESYRGAHPRLHVLTDLPLGVVTAIAERCTVFLAGDTGLAHMAAARGTPVVIIAGPTQVRSTRPWGSHVEVLTTTMPLPCMPCYGTNLYGTCSHVSCMTTLPPTQVVRAVLRVLKSEREKHQAPVA